MRFRSGSLVLILALGGLSLAGPLTFSVTPVAVPAGQNITNFSIVSLNNFGQVAGGTFQGGTFISSGGTTTIVPFPGDFSASTIFLNDSGQIAGLALSNTDPALPAYFGTSSGVGFVPGPSLLNNKPIIEFATTGLNNAGQFVGFAVSNGSPASTAAFIGTSGGIVLLPFDSADAINDQGHIVVDDRATTQTLVLDGGTATPIPGLNPFVSIATGINNSDQVVGTTNFMGSALVATTGGMTVIPGTAGTLGAYINDRGEVAGISQVGAWIWDPVSGLRLLSSIVPAGWSITRVQGLNDAGQILAFGFFTDPGSNAQVTNIPLLLTPTPEPATIFLAAIALLAFAIRRRYSPMM